MNTDPEATGCALIILAIGVAAALIIFALNLS